MRRYVRRIALRWKLVLAVAMAAMSLLWSGLPALTQDVEPARLSALEIALWPEFDEPELLVIFQGRLADDVPLPAVLTLTMPKEAGEPHAVASANEEGSLLTAEYELQTMANVVEVTYTSLEHRAFQFEYYVDVLEIEGDRRRFTFSYQSVAAVDDLVLELQQPLGATNVVLDPPAVETRVGYGDLTYHRLSFGAVKEGQTVSWQVSYDRSGSGLSAGVLPTDSPGSVTPPGATLTFDSAAAVVAMGAALALVGGFWVVRSRRQTERSKRGPRPREFKPLRAKGRKDRKGARPQAKSSQARSRFRPSLPVEPAESAAPQAGSFPQGGFCHRCGAESKPDALFCHRCGTKRKGT